jgi:uncharacterized protein (TIGR03083 family)
MTIDGAADDQCVTVIRQRRRMVDVFTDLTDDEWRSPSRCEGWTAQDVVAHLVGTNGFFQASILAGLAGAPTRYLATGFDPKATPAGMVDAMRSMTPAETLARFAESTDGLCEVLGSIAGDAWSRIAESPAGAVPIRLVAFHALWDSWVHERDILLPLGVTPIEEPDEVLACVRYAAAIGPALVAAPDGRQGALVLEVTEPTARVVVEVSDIVRVHDGPPPAGALTLRGRAAELTDALSTRAPLDQHVPDDQRWLLAGLADIFEVERT